MDKQTLLKKVLSEKGQLQNTILYDLEALKDCFVTKNEEDFNYHFSLLKNNLQDYFKKYEKTL